MKLETWIEKSGTSKAKVARAIGASRASMTRWCNGERKPEPGFAYQIQIVTSGAVSVEEWGYETSYPSEGIAAIWAWLFKNKLTITQGAEKLDLWPMTLRGWLEGKVPTATKLEKLCKGMGTKLSANDFKNIEDDDAGSRDLPRRRTSGKGKAKVQ